MNTQQLQIRAQKISQLNDYNLDIDTHKDNSYLLIGYNNGVHKENFKMTLGNFMSLVESNESSVDGDLDDIRTQIENINRRIDQYHNSYFISYNFKNITYNIVYNDKEYYAPGDNITLLLMPVNGFELPKSISSKNCNISYILNNDGSAQLIITCNGSGNMTVSGEAISTISYYFGYISEDASDVNIEYDYYPNGEFKNIKSVNITSTDNFILSNSCQFNDGSLIKINNIGSNGEAILLINSKFFNSITDEFIDDNNELYKLYPNGFNFAAMSFPYKCQTTIDGMTYWILLIYDSYNGAEYVFTKI